MKLNEFSTEDGMVAVYRESSSHRGLIWIFKDRTISSVFLSLSGKTIKEVTVDDICADDWIIN